MNRCSDVKLSRALAFLMLCLSPTFDQMSRRDYNVKVDVSLIGITLVSFIFRHNVKKQKAYKRIQLLMLSVSVSNNVLNCSG